ncbi:hypothetical protein T484DRAFT_1774488, partial [Baffinella frigidus]
MVVYGFPIVLASGFAGFILSRPRLAFIVVTLLSMVYGLLLMVHNEPTLIALFAVYGLLLMVHNEPTFIALFVVFP